MNELEVLKGTYAIIQNPERWTTGSLARDDGGECVADEARPCLSDQELRR